MDKEELQNWQKIKDALEAADKTDSFYYQRALAIVGGKPDPLELKSKKE
jgi:hypothetical protein|tara:strand:- start:933 stop:1079 length:147 start_codon:yes stop_codon:yes gene_type:complete